MANSRPTALNFKSFSSIEEFFLTVGQNNFGNKIPFLSVASPKNEPCFLGAITYVHTSLLVRENGVLKLYSSANLNLFMKSKSVLIASL